MSKFNPLPREELLGVREEEKIIKRCRRFNSFYPMFSDSKRGVIYLKLREKGCKKKSALSYCSKPICRTDSTRQTDGPSNNRTLKVKSNSLLTQNVK